MITAYKTLYAVQVSELDDLVNRAITEGWQPYRGQWCNAMNGLYFQVMVRHDYDLLAGEEPDVSPLPDLVSYVPGIASTTYKS